MPEYLAPGVYVEEISTGPMPIQGVSTSVAGFVGITERGPEDVRRVTSWLQFQRLYSTHMGVDKTYMTYAVQGFFDNGGQVCFIGRVVNKAAVPATKSLGNLTVFAIGRGLWGNNVFLRVQQATKATKGVAKAATWIRLQIIYFTDKPQGDIVDPFDFTQLQNPNRVEPDAIEDYDNLSPEPGSSNYLITTINLASQLVQIADPPAGQTPTGITPGTTFEPLTGGTEPALAVTDYAGNVQPIPNFPPTMFNPGWGMAAMEQVRDVSLLMIPDQVNDDNLTELIFEQCERNKDRFGIFSVAQTFDPNGTDPRPSRDTTYGAQYYPWIWIYDPFSNDQQLIPPTGHMAGIIANTDLTLGVHKPPANAVVVGARDLQRPVSKLDSAALNPVGINCIRDFRPDGRGIRLWGARTMSSDPDWKYINVRRLFLFIEKSIDQGTQWVVFEANSDPTWARVVRTITSFLVDVWRSGALMGTTQDQAFFVRCDRTTMTDDDINNGRLICYIGIAPVKPAEFVIFRIGQMTADAQS